MRNPKCGICRNRLNDDGSCRFAGSHQNILKMRADQAKQQSETTRGRRAVTPPRTKEEYQDMSRKAAAARTANAAPKEPKNPRRSASMSKVAAGKPRDKKGRFLRRKK